jgi:hypothetical protein
MRHILGFVREFWLWSALAVGMAFTNRTYGITNGFGTALLDASYLNAGIALTTTGQQSNTVPGSGSFVQAITRGYLRVKIYNGGGTSPTLVDLLITATDGTNTVTFYVMHPTVAIALATGITGYVDLLIPFEFEISATSITVKTTMGGTTPTANMDLEVAAVS